MQNKYLNSIEEIIYTIRAKIKLLLGLIRKDFSCRNANKVRQFPMMVSVEIQSDETPYKKNISRTAII